MPNLGKRHCLELKTAYFFFPHWQRDFHSIFLTPMLNPPLALISNELSLRIVEYVAKHQTFRQDLRNLSLTDRAFTGACQQFLFEVLNIGNSFSTKPDMIKRLETVKDFLDSNVEFKNRIRTLILRTDEDKISWLFENQLFIDVLGKLATSKLPPHALKIYGEILKMDNHTVVIGQLRDSFFSQSLTVLHFSRCNNIPLPIFLVCANLKEVKLDVSSSAEDDYEDYPDTYYLPKELPSLEILDYRTSDSVVRQMVHPHSRFTSGFINWSNLRVLKLSPHEKKDMALLQPLLNMTKDTLEELFLTTFSSCEPVQFPLAGLVKLDGLKNLQIFSLHFIIKPRLAVLDDISTVLSTLPTSNKITNLAFDIVVAEKRPFKGTLQQSWGKAIDEIIRISDKKPVEVEFHTTINVGTLEIFHGEKDLYNQIEGKAIKLSGHPNLCSHFWNPTCWERGIPPMENGTVRGRCFK